VFLVKQETGRTHLCRLNDVPILMTDTWYSELTVEPLSIRNTIDYALNRSKKRKDRCLLPFNYTWVNRPYGIRSDVFAAFRNVTNRQTDIRNHRSTDHATPCLAIGRCRWLSLRWGLIIIITRMLAINVSILNL